MMVRTFSSINIHIPNAMRVDPPHKYICGTKLYCDYKDRIVKMSRKAQKV